MIKKVFSIYDSKALAFTTPVFYEQVGMAERSITEVVNDGKSVYSKYPDDFTLYMIGEYDEAKGILVNSLHTNIGLLSKFVRRQPVVPEVVR